MGRETRREWESGRGPGAGGKGSHKGVVPRRGRTGAKRGFSKKGEGGWGVAASEAEAGGRGRAPLEEGCGGVCRRAGRSGQAYLVQSGHEKQDENEDVKGRDHQQEE